MTTRPDGEVTCALCSARYDAAEARGCRAGCPLGAACGLLRCPRCGYEATAPTRFTRWLAHLVRWRGAA